MYESIKSPIEYEVIRILFTKDVFFAHQIIWSCQEIGRLGVYDDCMSWRVQEPWGQYHLVHSDILWYCAVLVNCRTIGCVSVLQYPNDLDVLGGGVDLVFEAFAHHNRDLRSNPHMGTSYEVYFWCPPALILFDYLLKVQKLTFDLSILVGICWMWELRKHISDYILALQKILSKAEYVAMLVSSFHHDGVWSD